MGTNDPTPPQLLSALDAARDQISKLTQELEREKAARLKLENRIDILLNAMSAILDGGL